MLLKCCTQYVNKFGRLNSGHRTGKSQFLSSSKECSKYHTTALILHADKVMLRIFQARLQQYVSWELSDVHAGFRKGTIDLIANIHWIIEKAWEFQKNIYFWCIDYTKAFDCVNCNKLENSWEMGIPDHLTCLLRSLYTSLKKQ